MLPYKITFSICFKVTSLYPTGGDQQSKTTQSQSDPSVLDMSRSRIRATHSVVTGIHS